MSDHETNLTFTINSADIKELKEYMHGPDAFSAISDIKNFLRENDKYGLNPGQASMSPTELMGWIRGEILTIIDDNLGQQE